MRELCIEIGASGPRLRRGHGTNPGLAPDLASISTPYPRRLERGARQVNQRGLEGRRLRGQGQLTEEQGAALLATLYRSGG